MGRQSSFHPFSNTRRSPLTQLRSHRPSCPPCSIPSLHFPALPLCNTEHKKQSKAESWQESGVAASPTQPLSLHLPSKAPFSFQLFLTHFFIFIGYNSFQLIIITKMLLMTIQNKNGFNHSSAMTLQQNREAFPSAGTAFSKS